MLSFGLHKRIKLDYNFAIGDISNIDGKYGYIKNVIGKARPRHIDGGIEVHELTWDFDNDRIVLRLGEGGTTKLESIDQILLIFNYNAIGIIAEWDDEDKCYKFNNMEDYISPILHRNIIYIKISPVPEELIDLDFSFPKVGSNILDIIM